MRDYGVALIEVIAMPTQEQYDHLVALQESLDRKLAYVWQAKTIRERDARAHAVRMHRREIASTMKHMGMTATEDLPKMSDEELLAELAGK